MGLAVNVVAALVLALSIGFYVFVYTMWLKRRTPQNIVIGGAAGAFPAVIGWASVTGSVDLVPLVLFAIVFFWTPPHFWSLALFANADYQRAGVPMLPVVAGAKETRRQIVLYTLLLLPLSLAPWLMGFSGLVYGLSALVLGLGFLVSVWRVATDRQDASGVSLTNDALPARMAFWLFHPLSVRPVRSAGRRSAGGVRSACRWIRMTCAAAACATGPCWWCWSRCRRCSTAITIVKMTKSQDAPSPVDGRASPMITGIRRVGFPVAQPPPGVARPPMSFVQVARQEDVDGRATPGHDKRTAMTVWSCSPCR